jgi:hypothetical protein
MNEERDTDARLWHPWLRVLRVTLKTRCAQKRDPARGMVQLGCYWALLLRAVLVRAVSFG